MKISPKFMLPYYTRIQTKKLLLKKQEKSDMKNMYYTINYLVVLSCPIDEIKWNKK